MAAKPLPNGFFRLSALIVFVSMVATVAGGSQDHDVPVSVDGLRCDSCGSECSVMCGSRNFRACCYNYIKKRSIPWPNNGAAAGDHAEEETQDGKSTSPVAGTDLKASQLVGTSNPAKTSLLFSRQNQRGMGNDGKHFFRSYIPEIIGGDSVEEGAFLYPMSLRDLMTSMIRTLNAFENRKFGRVVF